MSGKFVKQLHCRRNYSIFLCLSRSSLSRSVLFRCGTRLAWTTLRFLIFLARWAVWALLLHQQKFSNGENTETSSRFTYLDQGFDPITAQPLGVETRNPWVRGVRYSRFFIEFQSFRVSSVQSTRFVTTYDLILSTMNLLKFFISGFTIHYYKKNI